MNLGWEDDVARERKKRSRRTNVVVDVASKYIDSLWEIE